LDDRINFSQDTTSFVGPEVLLARQWSRKLLPYSAYRFSKNLTTVIAPSLHLPCQVSLGLHISPLDVSFVGFSSK